MHPITAFEFWLGMGFAIMTLAVLAGGYCLHMWEILKDIAAEDAEEMADERFREYVTGMEYRVHFRETISIENEMEP